MEELKKNVGNIFDQFAQEEMGNRLSQFSLLALKNLILMEIDKSGKPEPEKKDV